jgi:pyruvate formate lyase activating enzyme
MIKKALIWEAKQNNKVECGLCYRHCSIPDNKRGYCDVRENRKGTLYTLNYALASSASPDPIEKKPLFHFHPGTRVFSLGTMSCNFRCLHCQNYTISQNSLEDANDSLSEYIPEKAISLSKDYSCDGIAWTYNEPTIWFEYTLDSAKVAKKNDLYTVYVSNGYFTEEAFDLISPYLDAVNIDVKGFSNEFFNEISGANLSSVLDTVESISKKDIHLELTYLIIPGKNDKKEELTEFVEWVSGLDANIPVHFTRFHPDFKMSSINPTPPRTIDKARDIGLKKLKFVYSGNIPGHKGENTYCPNCGKIVIKRYGFEIRRIDLTEDNRCIRCREKIPIIR